MAEVESAAKTESNGTPEVETKKIEDKIETSPDEKSPVKKVNGTVEDVKTEEVKESVADEKPNTEENTGANQTESMETDKSTDTEAKSNGKEEDVKAEEKTEDQAQKKDDSLGSTVAKHYNEIPAGSKDERKESRIYHLRNFNNWCKSVVINEFLEKIKRRKRTADEINVLDLGCGKGGDLLKWEKGKVDHVIMADIAETSVKQCKERYSQLEKDHKGRRYSREHLFTTEFIAADCTKEYIREKYKKKDIKLDLTSCQFSFHYSFESYEQADLMLKNACENLRVGGYFIGTTLNADKVVKHIKSMEGDSFGNSVFFIKPESKEEFPLFGSKYMFHLEGVVDCPEFLVHMPTMEKLAAKYHMKLVWKKNFHDLFKDYERTYNTLLHRMNALEVYPAQSGKSLCGGDDGQYKQAKEYLEKRTHAKKVGTLSSDEWEMTGFYIAFAFEKMEPPRESRPKEREDRKRRRDKSNEGHRSRENSRSSRHHEKRRTDSSSGGKRSRKESESEDVYEIKDEIVGDEEQMETSPTEKEAKTTPTDDKENISEDKEHKSGDKDDKSEEIKSDSTPSETVTTDEQSIADKSEKEEENVDENVEKIESGQKNEEVETEEDQDKE